MASRSPANICFKIASRVSNTVNYSYTGLGVIPEFAHTGDREFQSRAEMQLVHSLVFGYTGFLIYRTLNRWSQTSVRYESN